MSETSINLLSMISKRWKIIELKKQYALFLEHILEPRNNIINVSKRYLFDIWLESIQANEADRKLDYESMRAEFEDILRQRKGDINFAGHYSEYVIGDEIDFRYDDDRLNHAFYGFRLGAGANV